MLSSEGIKYPSSIQEATKTANKLITSLQRAQRRIFSYKELNPVLTVN